MKSFTTSVAASFQYHPDTFLPAIKEPNFFATDLFQDTDPILRWTQHGFANISRTRPLSRYLSLYRKAPVAAKYLVDASTSYLYSHEAARNIHFFNSDAKIIILLRDPVLRAWSEYKMNQAIGLETETFRSAIDRELDQLSRRRLNPYKRYVRAGLYAEQVERYLGRFSPENTLLCVVDAPEQNMYSIMALISTFLNLPSSKPLRAFNVNAAQAPPNMALNTFLYFTGIRGLIRNLTPHRMRDSVKQLYYRTESSTPAEADKAYLSAVFETSNRRLETLTGLDLSHWS